MTQDGRQPLHWAASASNLAITQLLLSCKPDVDARDAMGWTPLMIAGKFRNCPICTAG